jgi:XTP/dITP diphosphohydrolase
MAGHLTRAPRGTGGFGYDPIFVADGYDVTTAELTPEEKDAISHRGKAFRGLVEVMRRELA